MKAIVSQPEKLTNKCAIKASTANHRVNYMTDDSTETFWQSAVNADNDQFNYNRVHGTHWIQFSFPNVVAIKEIIWHLDWDRDREYFPKEVQIFVGESEADCEQIGSADIPKSYTGWFSFRFATFIKGKRYKPDANDTINAKFFWFKIPTIHDGQYEIRIRQLIIYGSDVKTELLCDSHAKKLERLQDGALNLFRRLVARCFLPTMLRSGNQKNEQTIKDKDKNNGKEKNEKN